MLDVKDALYAAKITSYAQGMNIIRAKSQAMGWNIDLGGLARIWKVSWDPMRHTMTAGTQAGRAYRFCGAVRAACCPSSGCRTLAACSSDELCMLHIGLRC